MKNLYESILGDVNITIDKADALIEEMKKIHWSYYEYTEKVYKNVSGGIGKVIKKHFPKKLEPIESYSLYNGIEKGKDLKEGKHKYNQPNIDYIIALILNTQLPEPIDSYNFLHSEPNRILDACITESLNKYMTDEWKEFRTDYKNYPILSAHAWVQNSRMEIQIYYHQNDIKYESALLCEIILRKTNNEKI